MRTAAILWDYDDTLIDSARKNMAVAVEVLRHFDSGIDGHLGLPGGGVGAWKTRPTSMPAAQRS